MTDKIRAKRPWLLNTNFELAVLNGWEQLILDLLDDIGAEMAKYPGARMRILQIKEKFAGLRFYFELRNGPEELLLAVRACDDNAEKRAWKTCEVCGQSGQLREDHNWYWVRCDEHAPEDSRIVPACE